MRLRFFNFKSEVIPMKCFKSVICLFSFLILISMNVYASESDSDDVDANNEKANRSFNSGIDHLHKAKQILIVGDSAFAYNYRATSDAKAKKEYEKAVDAFKETLEHNPAMKEAYNNLGFCYRKLGKLDESLKSYKRALKFDPEFAQALEYLGETYLAMDDLENANINLFKLTNLKSAYADTLAHAINKYKLNQINKKLQVGKK